MFDRLLDFVINATRYQSKVEQDKQKEVDDETRPVTPNGFWVNVPAGKLVEPARVKAKKHREREQVYTKKLEADEKELREKGVTIDVFDQSTGTYINKPMNITGGQFESICSGAISATGLVGAGNQSSQQFQPRIDQRLLDNVKNAKSKMLDHRTKAEWYEKYVRAFSLAPERNIRLTLEDVTYFGLGEQP